MKEMSWRPEAGVVKVAIVVTDATFKDPSPLGATLGSVLEQAKAKGILPVPIVLGF